MIESLWAAGARVQAYDPEAMEEARRLYPEQIADGRLVLCETEEEALRWAAALVICTEWRAFRAPDYEQIKELLAEPIIFDGRNIHDPSRMAREGITYYGIGLGLAQPPVSDPDDGLVRSAVGAVYSDGIADRAPAS